MRQVQVFKWNQERDGDGKMKNVRIQDGLAVFHQFSASYEEFESGAGNYAVAIIERADGSVQQVGADMIQFIVQPVTAAHIGAKWKGLADGGTLRDYFAAKALPSILAQDGYGIEALTPDAHYSPNLEERAAGLWARHAYAIADAMLAERAK